MKTEYPISEQQQADIDRRFTYHAPINDQGERYNALRARAKDLAEDILRLTPSSREQSLALTHLETAAMYANAAIARNESEATLPKATA